MDYVKRVTGRKAVAVRVQEQRCPMFLGPTAVTVRGSRWQWRSARKGILKPLKPLNPEHSKRSTVKGVYFGKSQWHAKLVDPSTKKWVHGGCFATQEEAESKARDLAKELGIEDMHARLLR